MARAIIPCATTLRKYWSSIFPECKYFKSSWSPSFSLSSCLKTPIQLIQICRFTQSFLVTTIYKTYLTTVLMKNVSLSCYGIITSSDHFSIYRTEIFSEVCQLVLINLCKHIALILEGCFLSSEKQLFKMLLHPSDHWVLGHFVSLLIF